MLKCLNCKKLIREKLNRPSGNYEVIYGCPKFPYWTRIDGLFRPGLKLKWTVGKCADPVNDCVVCGATEGLDALTNKSNLYICRAHHKAWVEWLDAHDDLVEYMHPKRRTINQRRYEVFREYVESERKCRVCGCTWERGCACGCEWTDWNLCSQCKEL